MESLRPEQACGTGSRLRMAVLQRNQSSLLPDLCANSSFYKISDEPFPYVSGIFDDTMDPSFMLNGPQASTDLPDQVQTMTKAQDEVVSGAQTKAAYNSWLSIPVESNHSMDFSMSVTSAQGDHEDRTESNPKGETPYISSHTLESGSCTEQGAEAKNSTFDMAKELKERFSGLNLTKPVSSETTGSSNVTFEKSEELHEKSSGLSCTVSNDDASLEDKHLNAKHLNSTVDVCGPMNSTTEQPNQKLDRTVDITQSRSPKHKQGNEGRTCSKDCDEQSTFTKATEDTGATVDLTVGVPAEVAQTGSVNVEPDRTFTKHTTTTDLTSPEHVPELTNTTTNIIKSPSGELPMQTNANCGETLKDTPASGPSAPDNTATPVKVDVSLCSDTTRDLPENDGKEARDPFRRRAVTSNGEGCLNLDTSQSSMFSLDEMLDLKPCPLVASTPIVLERGFDRLRSANPPNMQKKLPVINSIGTRLSVDMAGVGVHEGSDASKTNESVKSDACSQIHKVSANGTSGSTASEAAIVDKPPSKITVKRKILQPSIKSSIPKTQLLSRPSTLQVTSATVKSKTAAAAQALNQPETASSALLSMRRTVQLNKGKTLASAKYTSLTSNVKVRSMVYLYTDYTSLVLCWLGTVYNHKGLSDCY